MPPQPTATSFNELVGQACLAGDLLAERGWLAPEKAHGPPVRWSQQGGMSRRERALWTRIRKVAMQAYDKSGIDLVNQVLRHMEEVLDGVRRHELVHQEDRRALTIGEETLFLVQSIVAVRNTTARFVEAGYPHTGFVVILDDLCDGAARIVRRQIVQRLLDRRTSGEDAAEMLSVLQKQIDDGVWSSVAEDLDTWLPPDGDVWAV
jgi:hypothetical protein